ncbi:MAG: hypothetical protein A2079_04040 [Geobacteraceae bacterium GWC2_48_7]|nr:MAG: hypothetical protein A2079_04040 [Geobacteraceae bacterium GWC2_48_7]
MPAKLLYYDIIISIMQKWYFQMTKNAAGAIAEKAGWSTAKLHIGCTALVFIIFYIDLTIPKGVAIGALYIVAVLLAIWSPSIRFITSIAVVASLLVIIAYIFKPSAEHEWKSIVNRGLALTTIWITALLGTRIKLAEQELIRIASHDFLTGLLNRREMFNRLRIEVSRVDRVDKAFSLIMIDIDHFKLINDQFGHLTGDKVLKNVSRTLREHLREYDYVCRYGGEEFLVATPETNFKVAHDLAERLRIIVMNSRFSSPALPVISVTISAGVTQHVKGDNIETTLSRADLALYEAKNGGRNRVVVI